MSRIVLGYGDYRGYRLEEVPQNTLNELAGRYPLQVKEASHAELLITIAIHAEINRRASGGKQEDRPPTLRQCAEEIITRGHQQALDERYPHHKGSDKELHTRFTRARDELRKKLNSIPIDIDEHKLMFIPAQGKPVKGRPPEIFTDITDDDVPF